MTAKPTMAAYGVSPVDRRIRYFLGRNLDARWLLRMRSEHVGTWHLVPQPSLTGNALCGTHADEWHDAHSGAYIGAGHCRRCFRTEVESAWNMKP